MQKKGTFAMITHTPIHGYYYACSFKGPSTLAASPTVNTQTTSSNNFAFVKYDGTTGDAEYIKSIQDVSFPTGQVSVASGWDTVWCVTGDIGSTDFVSAWE